MWHPIRVLVDRLNKRPAVRDLHAPCYRGSAEQHGWCLSLAKPQCHPDARTLRVLVCKRVESGEEYLVHVGSPGAVVHADLVLTYSSNTKRMARLRPCLVHTGESNSGSAQFERTMGAPTILTVPSGPAIVCGTTSTSAHLQTYGCTVLNSNRDGVQLKFTDGGGIPHYVIAIIVGHEEDPHASPRSSTPPA